jgi:hypothetical protein
MPLINIFAFIHSFTVGIGIRIIMN